LPGGPALPGLAASSRVPVHGPAPKGNLSAEHELPFSISSRQKILLMDADPRLAVC
jgi:hypothetical protein